MMPSKTPENRDLLVVIDTNVLVSMLLWRGRSLELLYILLQQRLITPCFTPDSLAELERVLRYSHIELAMQKTGLTVSSIIGSLMSHAKLFPSAKNMPTIIKDDPTDNIFLACAIVAHAAYIISGDQHLLKIKKYKNIPILKPSHFLQQIIS